MLARIRSACVTGIDASPVDVEVDVSGGLPSFSVVGLPDTSIRESRDRIRSAIKNSGYDFPGGRVTVNLSPADLKKEGAGFDLPIATGILTATGLLNKDVLESCILCGELSLDGKLKNFKGALPIAITVKDRCEQFVLPAANAAEASAIEQMTVTGARSLRDVIEHLSGMRPICPTRRDNVFGEKDNEGAAPDMKDVKGQEHVKRGLEIAASGAHNILMIGPPGSGKSMLAKRFPGILPPMDREESLETTKVYSIAGQLKHTGLIRSRPIRSPHHTISYAAMAGGGTSPSPGEISLAHNGVLFLDELPEFRRDVLETLRQPVENGTITISRSQRSIEYPCRFILLTAMNPCPCGYFTDPGKQCKCSSHQIQRYLSKVSGPLLDRIDLHLDVPRLEYGHLSRRRSGENSRNIKKRVLLCRNIQKERFRDRPDLLRYNSRMTTQDLERFCPLSKEAEALLKSAVLELGISARAYDKILKISRTVADLDEKETIDAYHLSEAIGYRSLDRNIWA